MVPYNVVCNFLVSINNEIIINIPKTPNGGSGGDGMGVEKYIPETTTWEYQDTGEVETWTDPDTGEVYEYPIWDYVEVTVPAYTATFWGKGAAGQSAANITVTLPHNLRATSISLSVAGTGNGGNGGDGTDQVASGVDYDLNTGPFNTPTYNAAGAVGLGGRFFLSGLDRWTTDCDFSFSVGSIGICGTNNFTGEGVAGNVPGSYIHPDGADYLTWNGWGDNSVSYAADYFNPTNGYYGGDGGQPKTAGTAGGTGGNGIPVDGFRSPGQGGGTAADGIQLGSFWE